MVKTDLPHTDTVQLEVHEKEVGLTYDEGDDNVQGKQMDNGDEREGDGLEHDNPEGDGSDEKVSEGNEAEHEDSEGDEPKDGEHVRGDGGQEDAQNQVIDNIIEGRNEIDRKDVETGHDEYVKKVDATQAVPTADQNKK